MWYSPSQAERNVFTSERLSGEDSSVVLGFMDHPRVWILNNLLKGIWKKCQSWEQGGMLTQQADRLGFCSTGFPQGMWQLLNVFISAVTKMHLCTGFVPPTLPKCCSYHSRVQSGFCSLCSFKLLPHQLKSALGMHKQERWKDANYSVEKFADVQVLFFFFN